MTGLMADGVIKRGVQLLALAIVLAIVPRSLVQAAESVTYLFPAPPILPAFGPIQLAKGKGYFAEAGLDVSYAVGRGGVDVAKQVGAGNGPRQRRPHQNGRGVRRQGLHATRRA